MKKFLSLFIFSGIILFANAQSVGINNDGAAPNSSAILDIKSSNKGLLIPRVYLQNLSDNTTIPNPVVSLLVFNTNTSMAGGAGFYVWDGNNWVLLLSTANSNFLWSINGNAGTNGSHFVGTTDNARMGFRTNNFQSALLDPVQKNSFWGYKSGFNNTSGTNNTAIGNAALFSNQYLNSITAIGDSALYNNNGGVGRNTAVGVRSGFATTDGSGNSFLGYESGYNNTIGISNTGIGWKSLYSNSLGSENTALGVFSLQSNVNSSGNTSLGNLTMAAHDNGNYNTAIGYKSLVTDTSGADNTAAGAFSLYLNKTGIRNTVMGSNAAYFARTGNENTVLGFDAMPNNQNGSFNVAVGSMSLLADSTVYSTAIGYNAQVGLNNLTNTTAVGARAVVTKSNALVLGSIAGINGATENVNVGIGIAAPLARLHVKDSSVLFSSDGDIPFTPGVAPGSGPGRKMLWYADKAAFRVGYDFNSYWTKDSIGNYSFAAGWNGLAKGSGAVAMGINSKAKSNYSFAHGNGSVAGNIGAVAFGEFTEATGLHSFAMGYISEASGNYSVALGNKTVSSGTGSLSYGDSTFATGNYATAAGHNATATGRNAIANGTNVRASGDLSSAYGTNLVSSSYLCTVFGHNNDSIPGASKTTWVDTDPLFIVGNGYGPLSGQRWNALTIFKNGKAEFFSNVLPRDDNNITLGSSSQRWNNVFSVNGVTSTSDLRMKKNVLEIDYGLKTVMELRPVSFEWRKDSLKTHLGFIAQEIQQVIPDIVDVSDKGLLGMNYAELIPVLTKAIQEQQKQIESMQKKLELLEKNK